MALCVGLHITALMDELFFSSAFKLITAKKCPLAAIRSYIEMFFLFFSATKPPQTLVQIYHIYRHMVSVLGLSYNENALLQIITFQG